MIPALLALLPLVVYGRFIVFGDELANADVLLAYLPVHGWLADGLRHGTLPLWNPYILGGFPIAFSEYGWFSPLNWMPLALFGGHAGFYLAVAIYVALAGLAAYGLGRAWGLSRAGSLLAALVFGQSLYVVGGAPLLNQGAAYWTLPALLWAIFAHFRGNRVAAPVAGIVVALSLLGSHPQLALIALVPGACFALLLLARTRRLLDSPPLLLAYALGAAVSAVRFLPTVPLVAASERSGGLALSASAIGSVNPLAMLAGLVFPSLALPRFVTPLWALYLGPLPLVFASYALARRKTLRQQTSLPAAFLVVLALAGIVLAFGAYTPIYRLVLKTPLLSYFREPSRFLLWTVLAISLLAGGGLELAVTTGARLPPRARRWLVSGYVLVVAAFAAVSVGLRLAAPRLIPMGQTRALSSVRGNDYPPAHYLAAFGAAWRQLLHATNPLSPGLLIPLLALGLTLYWWYSGRQRSSATESAIAICAATLLAYGQTRLPAITASIVQQATQDRATVAGAASAAAPGGGERVLSWLPLAADYETRLREQATDGDEDAASYLLLSRLLAPNLGIVERTAQLDGYENLMSHEQALLTAALGSERSMVANPLDLSARGLAERRQLIGRRWNLAAAAGVSALVSADTLQPLTWPVWVTYAPAVMHLAGNIPSISLFALSRPMPRAFVITDWRVARSAEDVLQLLASAPLDAAPPTFVVDPSGELHPPSSARAGGLYDAQIVAEGPQFLEVETEADGDALLVVLDANAPGWSATVSGASAPIVKANVAFRAVQLPAGHQLVRFSYTPPHWRAGLVTTVAASLVLAFWSIVVLATRRPVPRYTH